MFISLISRQLRLHHGQLLLHLLYLCLLLLQQLLCVGLLIQLFLRLGRRQLGLCGRQMCQCAAPAVAVVGVLQLGEVGETSHPVVLVVDVMGNVLQVLHVGLDEEAAEEGKVGVFRVVHLHEAPGILTAADLLALDLHSVGATHDGEGNTGLQEIVLRLEFIVLVRVAVGELIDLDVVVLDLLVDPLLDPLELGKKEKEKMSFRTLSLDR